MHQKLDWDGPACVRGKIERLVNQRLAVAALMENRLKDVAVGIGDVSVLSVEVDLPFGASESPWLESCNERQNACPIRRLDREFHHPRQQPPARTSFLHPHENYQLRSSLSFPARPTRSSCEKPHLSGEFDRNADCAAQRCRTGRPE